MRRNKKKLNESSVRPILPPPAPQPKEQKYWIFSEIEECMLCGRSSIHKIRMPMPKPENIHNRWHYDQKWCGCE